MPSITSSHGVGFNLIVLEVVDQVYSAINDVWKEPVKLSSPVLSNFCICF